VTRRWMTAACAAPPLNAAVAAPNAQRLCEIVLSRPLLEPLPQTAMLGNARHEMIHAWIDRAGVREVHGACFRAPWARSTRRRATSR